MKNTFAAKTFAAATFACRTLAGGSAIPIYPNFEGLHFSMPTNRTEFTASKLRASFTMPTNRTEFTAPDET